jgi:hypothetical protein
MDFRRNWLREKGGGPVEIVEECQSFSTHFRGVRCHRHGVNRMHAMLRTLAGPFWVRKNGRKRQALMRAMLCTDEAWRLCRKILADPEDFGGMDSTRRVHKSSQKTAGNCRYGD